MDTFSRLDSTIPISPETSRVWKTHKRRGTGNQKKRDEEQHSSAKNDKKDGEFAASDEENTGKDRQKPQNPHEEEQAVYGTNGHKKNISRKIDVII